MQAIRKAIVSFLTQEDGQAISEYAFCLAFVAMLAILCFNLVKPCLGDSLFTSYSKASGSINKLTAATPKPTP